MPAALISWLLECAIKVADAMLHLSSMNVMHKDLAARHVYVVDGGSERLLECKVTMASISHHVPGYYINKISGTRSVA